MLTGQPDSTWLVNKKRVSLNSQKELLFLSTLVSTKN